jgi:hypothetical protein
MPAKTKKISASIAPNNRNLFFFMPYLHMFSELVITRETHALGSLVSPQEMRT